MQINSNTNIVFSKLEAKLKANKIKIMTLSANQAVNFSIQRFREQGWVDTGFESWKQRKNKDTGRGLLIKSGALRNSIRVVNIGNNHITIGCFLPYAKIHNEGGVTHPAVTEKMKKYAWRKSYQTKSINDKNMWKGIALKKVGEKLTVTIPKRQFIGKSHHLSLQIRRIVYAHLLK